MKEWEPGALIILYGPRFFSDSFFDGQVVLKNLALTNTLSPTLNGELVDSVNLLPSDTIPGHPQYSVLVHCGSHPGEPQIVGPPLMVLPWWCLWIGLGGNLYWQRMAILLWSHWVHCCR